MEMEYIGSRFETLQQTGKVSGLNATRIISVAICLSSDLICSGLDGHSSKET